MVDYSPYSEKTIRNKKKPSEEEKAYADMLVEDEVNRILTKYANEEKFLGDVAYKLAQRIIKTGEVSNGDL